MRRSFAQIGDIDNPAEGGLAGIGRRRIVGFQVAAYPRMDTVGADHPPRPQLAAIAERQAKAVRQLFQADQFVPEMQMSGRNGLDQGPVQIAPVDRQILGTIGVATGIGQGVHTARPRSARRG